MAVEKFADSIETIPLVLAENAGMDVIDTQVQLPAKVTNAAKPKYGIDVVNSKVADVVAKDIYEPLAVKEQVINAAEAACMILRIDDVIAASKPKTPAAGAVAGAGGMGSHYGGDYD